MCPEHGPPPGERGFTLLEVLVAFIIAALALGVMFEAALGGLRSTETASHYQEALSLARSHLASINAAPLGGRGVSGDDGRGFHWSVRIKPAGTITLPRRAGRGPLAGSAGANDAVLDQRHRNLARRRRRAAGAPRQRAARHRRGEGRMRRRAPQAGFTLLEILVALVVLGFLLLGLAEGVRFGLRAWDTETRLVDRGADMDAMERVMRHAIVAADPGDFNEAAAVPRQAAHARLPEPPADLGGRADHARRRYRPRRRCQTSAGPALDAASARRAPGRPGTGARDGAARRRRQRRVQFPARRGPGRRLGRHLGAADAAAARADSR